MQHAAVQRAEHQHVLARVARFAGLLRGVVYVLYVRLIRPECVGIHVAHSEAERHRLAQAVRRPPQPERAAALRRQIAVAGAVNVQAGGQR